MGLYSRDYALAPEALERTRARPRSARSQHCAGFKGVRVPDALDAELVPAGSRVELARRPRRVGAPKWLNAVADFVVRALRLS